LLCHVSHITQAIKECLETLKPEVAKLKKIENKERGREKYAIAKVASVLIAGSWPKAWAYEVGSQHYVRWTIPNMPSERHHQTRIIIVSVVFGACTLVHVRLLLPCAQVFILSASAPRTCQVGCRESQFQKQKAGLGACADCSVNPIKITGWDEVPQQWQQVVSESSQIDDVVHT
jgi:hypothetical protein